MFELMNRLQQINPDDLEMALGALRNIDFEELGTVPATLDAINTSLQIIASILGQLVPGIPLEGAVTVAPAPVERATAPAPVAPAPSIPVSLPQPSQPVPAAPTQGGSGPMWTPPGDAGIVGGE